MCVLCVVTETEETIKQTKTQTCSISKIMVPKAHYFNNICILVIISLPKDKNPTDLASLKHRLKLIPRLQLPNRAQHEQCPQNPKEMTNGLTYCRYCS